MSAFSFPFAGPLPTQLMPGLPLSPHDARRDDEASPRKQAWQRELHRAKSALGAQQVVAFLQGLGDIRAEPLQKNLVVEAAGLSAPLDADCGADAAALDPRGPGQFEGGAKQVAHPSFPSTPQAETARTPSTDRRKASVHSGAARPPLPVPTGTARAPVRVHADWSADGVRIWLGMDASAALAVQSIASQLQRWLAAQGVRGLAITCNGRTVVENWPAGPANDFTEPAFIDHQEHS